MEKEPQPEQLKKKLSHYQFVCVCLVIGLLPWPFRKIIFGNYSLLVSISVIIYEAFLAGLLYVGFGRVKPNHFQKNRILHLLFLLFLYIVAYIECCWFLFAYLSSIIALDILKPFSL
jgi:hypothetical protein